jgi:hypothetical protein
MESESSVVESPTEPSSAPVEAPVAPEVPVEQAPEAPVTTEAALEVSSPPAPFPTAEEPAPAPAAPAMTPGKIELTTGKVHDIQDISVCEDLSRQAGAGFQEFIRVDGKPINISLEEIVSYE